MAKKKITEIVEEITADFLAEKGLELYNSEFVKEGKDWFLRVYIDRLPKEDADGNVEEEYVSTDDCEGVSRFLSSELDRLDPIEQNYYLEVSSPGLDRALIKEKDFIRFSGRMVDISLYKAVDGKKTYQGILKGLTEDNKIVITDENEEEIEFPREQVAKTRLAVIF
ncbi:MAG: ribosome maturation factor RimP [Firmicutes bacterium]|nr:ribosome maturation factor RimP [Bacillota bacterium]